MKTSPTQRSLKLLREAGYQAAVLERWNQFAHVRQDLWGFGDLIAAKASQNGSILVQTTTTENMGARIKKILAIPEASVWLAAGNQIIVHGWAKRGDRSKRKLWECKVHQVSAEDFMQQESEPELLSAQ
jgi:hypothetical protein